MEEKKFVIVAFSKGFPYILQMRGVVNWFFYNNTAKVAATRAALSMTTRPIRLIAGGRLKEENLGFLKVFLTKRVKKVYLINNL